MGIIFAAIALSGKLSMSASRALLVIAWVIAIVGIYRLIPSPLAFNWVPRSLYTMLGASVIGIGLYYLGQWFDVTEIKPPETQNAKQSFGQVYEYLGKDTDVVSLPLRVGAVTTTSTSTIDLFRVSPVNPISPMTPFFVVGHFTKTNSDSISLGLKLNKILIGPTPITIEQKTGTVTWFIGTDRMSLRWKSRNQSHQTDLSDERPVAPIRDIAFQGSADSGTLSIDEAWIYTLPIKN